jgi:hypothetical protein
VLFLENLELIKYYKARAPCHVTIFFLNAYICESCFAQLHKYIRDLNWEFIISPNYRKRCANCVDGNHPKDEAIPALQPGCCNNDVTESRLKSSRAVAQTFMKL